MLIAAQHMAQITDDRVRNSLYNCALKFVARTNADIHNLARSMGATEPYQLGTVPKYHFAFFSPDLQTAELVKFPLIKVAPTAKEDIAHFSRPVPPAPPVFQHTHYTRVIPAPAEPPVPEPEQSPDLGEGATAPWE
jgi:hypothetical protein